MKHYSLRSSLALMTLTTICLCTLGCVPRAESEVVVYVSVDREFAEPILDAFERAQSEGDPIAVKSQFDVESNKTLGLSNRLLQESKRPRCDVFWNGEILQTVRLQKAGMLEPLDWQDVDPPRSQWIASDRTWRATAARVRVLLVNPDKLAEGEELPKSVFELADQKWKMRCGFAKPIYGSTNTHFTALRSYLHAMYAEKGDAIEQTVQTSNNHLNFEDWIRDIRANAVVLSGNKQVALAVSNGELAWGLTDTDDARIEIERNSKLKLVFPDQGDGDCGAMLVPTTVAVIHQAPHILAAKRIAAFLSSPTVQGRLTMGQAAEYSLVGNLPDSLEVKGRSIKWMKVDFEALAETWEETSKQLMTAFR